MDACSSYAIPSSSKRKVISSVSVPCAPETNCEQPTSSSSKKPKYEPPSLSCLPEELLTQIFIRVAATHQRRSNLLSVAAVSKQFMRLCEQQIVLRSLASSQVNSVMRMCGRRCLGIGHPHAQFIQGIPDYFVIERRELGLMNLSLSANQGHREAIYVLGMVLFCLGGPERQKGLNMLNSLMHPSCLNESMRICRDLRNATVTKWDHLFMFSEAMENLGICYLRDRYRCHCNGKTAKFVELCWWDRTDRILKGEGVPYSEVCQNCFWDNDVDRFFYLQRRRERCFNYY